MSVNTQNPSQTNLGKNEEFFLQLARGHISNHSFNHKFGAVPSMSQNQSGTIWDVNDTLYPWNDFNTAGSVTIPTVHASDAGATVTIQGLDENYLFASETVTVANGTPVSTETSWSRVNRAFFIDDNPNVGVIDIQKNSNTVAKINVGKAQTLMSIYTIPADTTGYLTQGTCSIKSGGDATVDMFVRYGGEGTFRVGHSFEIQGDGGQYFYRFSVPIALPEKTDIDVRALVRSNNARVTAAFDVILIDN